MGKLYQGIDVPFSGKVGDVVGYRWKQRACIRAYRHQINYPDTESQQQQRNWFVSMVRFASQATQALRLGFGQLADQANMTEGNYFILKNKQHFHRGEGSVIIDYNKLQIAAGTAADVYFRSPRFEQNETIVIDFEKNGLSLRASADDDVYVYVYAPSIGEGKLSAAAKRRDKQLRMRLPETWAGREVQVYGFVVDREGRPSNSTYIGVGRVNHYEDRGKYIPLDNNWKEFVELAHENTQEEPKDIEVAGQETLPNGVGNPPEVP